MRSRYNKRQTIGDQSLLEKRVVRGNIIFFMFILPSIVLMLSWYKHVMGHFAERNALLILALMYIFLFLAFHFLWGRRERQKRAN